MLDWLVSLPPHLVEKLSMLKIAAHLLAGEPPAA